MLSINNISVHYGVIAALHGISLEVAQGDIVTLIGANGAGKTTTLRAISGLVKAQGEILYQGRNLANLPAHEIVAAGISHVPEGRMVFANLTVAENLEMGAYLQHNKHHIRQDRDFVFGIFPRLAERQKQIAGTLSSRAVNSRCWPSAGP
jgi:branched-chain amino acid transport system ATP-binding protein